jgi:hypothetical protein
VLELRLEGHREAAEGGAGTRLGDASALRGLWLSLRFEGVGMSPVWFVAGGVVWLLIAVWAYAMCVAAARADRAWERRANGGGS